MYIIEFWRKYESDNTKEVKRFYLYAETQLKAMKRFIETMEVRKKDIVSIRKVV